MTLEVDPVDLFAKLKRTPAPAADSRSAHRDNNSIAETDLENDFPALSTSQTSGNSATISWGSDSGYKPGQITGSAIITARAKKVPLVPSIVHRFDIPSHQQAKPQQLGAKSSSPGDVCRGIMQRTGTSIELSISTRTKNMSILVSGPPDAVQAAKREIMSTLCAQVTASIIVPDSVRPHILGAGGKNLKSLTARTMTKINFPRKDPNKPMDHIDSDAVTEQPITIIGDFAGVEIAKGEIEAIITARTSRSNVKLAIERSFHPFICGPNNSTIQLIMLETGAKIRIPNSTPSSGEKNLDEIIVQGDKEDVASAVEKINSIYEEVKSTTRTLAFPVSKRQHKFVAGPKGSVLQSILAATGCFVEIPVLSDPSDIITIRGPDTSLSQALNMVVERANSTIVDDVNISALLPPTTNSTYFTRYLFAKHRTAIKEMESNYSGAISISTSLTGNTLLEIQCKTHPNTQGCKLDLTTFVKDLAARMFFAAVEIPRGLHKYVIGKGGANIARLKAMELWNGSLVDIIVPGESECSDDVIVVVRRGDPGTISDEKAVTLVGQVGKELLSFASNLADYCVKVVAVEAKYHGMLIGSGGERLKEILGDAGSSVVVRFPSLSSSAISSDEGDALRNQVAVKGPMKLVEEVVARIIKLVDDRKHLEDMSSFSERVKVPIGVGRKIVGQGPSGLMWLVKAVKESLATNARESSAPSNYKPMQAQIVADTSDPDFEYVLVTGTKEVVEAAQKLIPDRAQVIADTGDISVRIFEEVSAAALAELKDAGESKFLIRNKIMRRIIGKAGKNVKELSEKHGVDLRFARASKTADGEDESGADDRGFVQVRGPKSNVSKARQELLELVEYELLHSHGLKFDVPKSCLPVIVGRGGSNINKLKNAHDIRVEFVNSTDESGNEIVEAHLQGRRANCEAAKKEILSNVNLENRTLKIPSYLHRSIIGPAGAGIRKIIEDFGGPDKVKIQFPAPARRSSGVSADSDDVVVQANCDQIEFIEQEIQRIVSSIYVGGDNLETLDPQSPDVIIDEGSIIEEILSIPRSDVARIVDRGGKVLKELMAKFGVNVWIADVDNPEQSDEGQVSIVRIVGRPGKERQVQGAKDEIMSKLRSVKTLPIPQIILERLMGPEKAMELASLQDYTRRIMDEQHVQIEISTANSSMTIRGDRKGSDVAIKEIKKVLSTFETITFSSEMIVSVNHRPHIIGRSGQTINKLRSETGCLILLLKSKSADQDRVVIRGSEESVGKAYESIHKIVTDQVVRQTRDRESAAKREEASSVSMATNARVDDEDLFSNDGSERSYARPVPGWSQKPRGPVSTPLTAVIDTPVFINATRLDAAQAAPTSTWKAVTRGKKKGTPDERAADDATEGISKKKKKKKKPTGTTNTSSAAITETNMSQSVEAIIPTPVDALSRPPALPIAGSITSIIVTKPESTTAKIQKINESSISTNAEQSTSTTSLKATKIEQTILKPASEPKRLVETEWQTISVKKKGKIGQVDTESSIVSASVLEMAAALGLQEETEKKKKRRKKKKSVTEV